MNIKKDFPIFNNHKGLVYFDSTATTQKPSFVIDAMKQYLENDYSNIHRGAYDIAEKSEKLYVDSKKKVADYIGASNWKEIIYTMNSTYAANLLASSIGESGLIRKGDVILVSVVEHHANIVPWQILAKNAGAELQYVGVTDDYSLDMDDLTEKLKNPKLKIVSLTHVSNVTGEIFPLEEIGKIIKKLDTKPLFFVDASQSVPHFKVDVQTIGCEALFFTGHKIMADSGIGVLYGKKDFLDNLSPSFSGGGAISWVHKDTFKSAPLPDKFEPGTPNMTGAVSLLKALEYIDTLGGYEIVEKIENDLIEYMLKAFDKRPNIKLIGSTENKTRVGVFSFIISNIHSIDVAEYLAEKNICIRAGQHCAEPFMMEQGISGSCRASLYIYNTREDIDKFFEVVDDCIVDLTEV